MTAPMVAGTYGSEESLAAVAWAAVTPAQRHVPLCILHVMDVGPGSAARTPLLGHEMAGRLRHDLTPHAPATSATRCAGPGSCNGPKACPGAWTPSSASTAPGCPAASGNGSRWRALSATAGRTVLLIAHRTVNPADVDQVVRLGPGGRSR
jgi:hypothetical protein